MRQYVLFSVAWGLFFVLAWTKAKYPEAGFSILMSLSFFALGMLERTRERLQLHAPPTSFPLPHRDDVDIDMMEAIEAAVQEQFPGYKIRFTGDVPEDQLPPEVAHRMRKLQAAFSESLAEGCCWKCRKSIPGYEKWVERCDDGTDEPLPLPEGFGLIKQINGHPLAWECDDCDPGENLCEVSA